jgi:hypothetical protein
MGYLLKKHIIMNNFKKKSLLIALTCFSMHQISGMDANNLKSYAQQYASVIIKASQL